MKINIIRIQANTGLSFNDCLNQLQDTFLQAISPLGGLNGLVWSRMFFSDIANQLEDFKSHALYRMVCNGALSCIEQPPLGGSKIALIAGITEEEIVRLGTESKRVILCNGMRFFFESVRFSQEEALTMSPKQQTMEAFLRHTSWLKKEGLTLKDHCHRTWLYVRDIDNNYRQVVEGRNVFFEKEDLTPNTHFIASTGIEGNCFAPAAAVGIDFWSVDDENCKVRYLSATDYLNPTHEYGVAFERGTLIETNGTKRWLISGTASIDNKGVCLHRGNVIEQANRLFLNIEKLLEDGRATLEAIKWMTVYLRDISDYGIIQQYLIERFPNLPFVIVAACVCRPEWLIEVEAAGYRFE